MSLIEISENEAELNEESFFGNKDIIEIVYKNDPQQFMDFLKESGPDTDLNVLAKQGLSLAHIAASNNCLQVLSELTSRGVQLHHIDDNCETVLHAAARKASKNVLTFLIDSKVEINFQNKNGDSPLHCAVSEGNLVAVDLLCKANCKINLRNKNGETALCLAVILGKLDSAQILLNHKADVNAEDKNAYTPLHHAICRHQSTIALMLINSGAHVNQPDLDRNTPLHLATKEGQLPVVQALCAYGCRVDSYNNEGFTALQVGARLGLLDIVRCLLLAGASPFIPSKENVYPDIMAYARGHKKTGALLHKMSPEKRAICIEQLVPTSRPIGKIKLKVFGSSMSGKTALIEVLKSGYIRGYLSTKLKSFDFFTGSDRNFMSMKERTSTNDIRYELDHEEYTKGIDVQSINISGAGDFSVWEFSGYEPYYAMYDHFIGDTSCLHLITINGLDSLELIKFRMRFWLQFLWSRIVSREPLEYCGKTAFMAKIIIVVTHAQAICCERNANGQLENVPISFIFNEIRNEFQFNLEIHDHILFVDSTDKVSVEMKNLKIILNQMRSSVVEKLPPTNGLVDNIASRMGELITKQDFPVLSWQQFVEKVRNKINPLCNEDHLKDLLQQLQYMGEVIYLETESEPDMIIMSPNWLCSDVLGFLLSFENISNSRVTGSFTSDEVQFMLGVDNTTDFLRILTSLDFCSACSVEDEIQYEFPCLNFVDSHDDFLPIPSDHNDNSRYIGIQFHTSHSQFSHLFPRLQVQFRRSICEGLVENSQIELDQWFHGSLLVCHNHEVQCMLSLESNNQVIEIKAKSPNKDKNLVVLFGFFQDTLNIVTQTIDEICPNLEYDTFCIDNQNNSSTSQFRQSTLFSQGEIMRAMMDCDGEIDKLDPTLRTILFFDNKTIINQIKLGPNLHVSSLRLPAIRKLCQMLDPIDLMGRDWCLLALKLGLNNDVPKLDISNEHTLSKTGSVISIWGTKNTDNATIKTLINVLKEMDRLDAAFLLTTSIPLYQFIPLVTADHDFESI